MHPPPAATVSGCWSLPGPSFLGFSHCFSPNMLPSLEEHKGFLPGLNNCFNVPFTGGVVVVVEVVVVVVVVVVVIVVVD